MSQTALIDQLRTQRPRIVVTATLIVANLAVFVAMLVQGAGLGTGDNSLALAWGANFGPATKDGEWWRLGSAMFLHFSLLHLGMNMLSLWDAGRLVERMTGPLRFALIYLGSGLAGNLLSLMAQGDRAVSGGASGAIFGLYGALIVGVWYARARLHPGEFKRLFWGALGFSALMLGLGLQIKGIDNAAHLGGLLAGVLLAALLHPPAPPAPGLGVRTVAGLALAGALSTLALNIPAPRYRWSEEQSARSEIIEFLGEDRRLAQRWQRILDNAGSSQSFDALAGRIDQEIAQPYEQSFEELSRLHLSPHAPSAATLEALRQYSEQRRDASRELVDGLRERDPAKVREALKKAGRARAAPAQRTP